MYVPLSSVSEPGPPMRAGCARPHAGVGGEPGRRASGRHSRGDEQLRDRARSSRGPRQRLPALGADRAPGLLTRDLQEPCPSLAQIALEDTCELVGQDHAAHELTGLHEVWAIEGGAVAEPEGQPVPRLAERMRLRPAHRATEDRVDERLDVSWRGNPDGRARRRRARVTASDIDGAHLSTEGIEMAAHLCPR